MDCYMTNHDIYYKKQNKHSILFENFQGTFKPSQSYPNPRGNMDVKVIFICSLGIEQGSYFIRRIQIILNLL